MCVGGAQVSLSTAAAALFHPASSPCGLAPRLPHRHPAKTFDGLVSPSLEIATSTQISDSVFYITATTRDHELGGLKEHTLPSISIGWESKARFMELTPRSQQTGLCAL